MKSTLIDQLVEVIPKIDFIKEMYPEWNGKSNSNVLCPFDHDGRSDTHPSLSFNSFTGAWSCKAGSCERRGKNLVGHWIDRYYPDSFTKGLAVLYERFIGPVKSNKEIAQYRAELRARPQVIERITRERGWLYRTMENMRLGWDPKTNRVTIPIYTQEGICTDVRRHDSIRSAPAISGKRVSVLAEHRSHSGVFFPISPRINPFDVSEREIWCVEGEPDAISAWQEGINAITVTGGVVGWGHVTRDLLANFEGKDIIICFDSDSAGKKAAQALAQRLLGVGVTSLKIISVVEGNDIGEFLTQHHGTGEQLKQRAEAAQYNIAPKQRPSATVPLGRTSEAQFIGGLIETYALINGKYHTPHAVPRRIEFSCVGEACVRCPCVAGKGEYFVELDSPSALGWLHTKDYSKTLKSELGVSQSCIMHLKVTDWQNMEQVTLIPALRNSSKENKEAWCSREAYYIGHGIEANQSYRMEIMPVVGPRNESRLIIQKADNTYDSIKTFHLSEAEVRGLAITMGGSVESTIRGVCQTYARNYTRIYRRWELHAAVDLTFHSPLDFSFASTRLPKGSIELLLLGDTRCGKGQVAEGISRALDLGEVISGENTSLMGLAGGLAKGPSDSWQLTWGALPLNHGRLVILDEFSSLGTDIIGRLSRIRSEGVAEISKGGITSRTRANTRLIWIANPRGGRSVSDFSSGVEGIRDLIGAQEDIARFDLAVVVQRGEVPVEHINRADLKTVDSKFTREVLQKVVRWVWSLSPEDVNFEDGATQFILDQAIALSERYSPNIPLVQGENVRFKLAKLAAAVAGRCFSTPDGTSLVVTLEHAQFAIKFLKHCYDSEAMGYGTYSKLEKQVAELKNHRKLDTWLGQFEDGMRKTLIDGMLSMYAFRVPDLQDWTEQDGIMAKKYASILVQAHAVKMVAGKGYIKRPSFIEYLKNYEKE